VPVAPARSAVRLAWICGRKQPPGPLLQIELFPFEQQLVITEQDERIRARTGTGHMAMAVHIAWRDQCHHVAAAQGALVSETQVGAAALVADSLPSLMSLDSADRRDRDPAMVRVGERDGSLRPVKQQQARAAVGPDQPCAACLLRGDIRDERAQVILVGRKVHQHAAHAVAIEDSGRMDVV